MKYQDKKVAVFGSTGSIGRQTLDVMEKLGMRPFSLSADKNVRLMEEQIRAFRPRFASLRNEDAAKDLRVRVSDLDTEILAGDDAAVTIASMPGYDTALCAFSGVAGLPSTLAAVESGRELALANKETLVCGGDFFLAQVKKAGIRMLPVDSEHSAIFQSLACGTHGEVDHLILTCSGGPFFGKDAEFLSRVTPADALRHPNWAMGPKITVDSATLMNKGLELIEAIRLFGMPPERIRIVIHRESVFHSFVAYRDGAVIGQAAWPDMRLPIQYALTYPERLPSPVKPLSLAEAGTLTFYEPDPVAFPCLRLATEAAFEGKGAPVVLNGANEEAVAAFLRNEARFTDIPRAVEHALLRTPHPAPESFEDIRALDGEARRKAREALASLRSSL